MARLQKKKSVTKKVNKSRREGESASAEATLSGSTDKDGRVSNLQKSKKGKTQKSPFASRVSTTGGRLRFVQQSIQFLKEVKVELKKVVWPSRKQTVTSTIVVIALVMILSVFLGIVDAGLSSLVRVVLN